jgi:hypothetical protein
MFAAIVLLLTRELHRDRHGVIDTKIEVDVITYPIALMLGALFSLVIAAFLFAAMAGDGGKTEAGQFVEGTMPCLALSIGVVQMTVALTWLLHKRGLHGPPLELALYVVDAAIAIVAVFLPGVFLSPSFQDLGLKPLAPIDVGGIWVVMVAVLLLAIPIGRLVRRRAQSQKRVKEDLRVTEDLRAKQEPRPPHDLRAREDALLPVEMLRPLNVFLVSIVVIAAVLWNVLSSTPETGLDSIYETFTGVAMVAFVLCVLAEILGLLEAAAAEVSRTKRAALITARRATRDETRKSRPRRKRR